MAIKRNSTIFSKVEREYWDYYLELEDDFLATRKYVAFYKSNFSVFSMEYLKLFQAVCSEIDVVGKAMAAMANPDFEPKKKGNNILKWWFEIQDSYLFFHSASDAISGTNGIKLYDCNRTALGRFDISPWQGFRTEWRHNTKGRQYCRAVNKSTPKWWSAYNDVKHNRMMLSEYDNHSANYEKACLGNLLSAFAGLHVLESTFLLSLGTTRDLEAFASFGHLFHKMNYSPSEDLLAYIRSQ